jgi:HEAT repeat protein
VRITAVDTLKTLPATASGDGDTYKALIEALKNDPNPSVRMKAVEALVNLARSGAVLSTETLDTLRQKASQGDENLYVRVKAAEALKNVHP